VIDLPLGFYGLPMEAHDENMGVMIPYDMSMSVHSFPVKAQGEIMGVVSPL